MIVRPGRGRALDEHLDRPPDPGLVPGETDRLLDREQLVQASSLDVGSHVVGQPRRRRPGSDRVGRREHLVVADGLEERERRGELGVGLAAEPDDHVGRDGDPRDGRPDRRESLEIVLDRVLAAHPAQDRIVARLDRQVEVLADRRTVGHRRDQPVRQVPRVRRHEPETRDRRDAIGGPDGVDRPDELGQVGPAGQIELAAGPALGVDVPEARLRRQVVAVRVHVLAEQRDLPIAGRGERARLGDDLVERPAALGAPAQRDDAVGARLVAAVDDREPRAERRTPGDRAAGHRRRPRGREMVGRADHGPPDDRRRAGRRGSSDRGLGRGQPEPIDQLGFLVGAEEQVDRRVAAAQAVAVGLADRAAGQDDAQARVRGLQPVQVALPADDLLLGTLADRARVDHDEIGGLEAHRLGAARGQQLPGHLLGVAPVHLAAQRPQVEGRQRGGVRRVLGQPVVVGFGRSTRGGARRRRRDDVEDRQLAVHRAEIDPVCGALALDASQVVKASPTSGGTHSWACASAYGPVSPW